MGEVQRFLEAKHRQHYRVFNLCCEPDRQYDAGKFQDEVALFGFKDHNAPPLPLLLACCQDMDAWLLKHPCLHRQSPPYCDLPGAALTDRSCFSRENVCAIHCKAGKGRTGTVICAYFAYASQFGAILSLFPSFCHFPILLSLFPSLFPSFSLRRYDEGRA